MFCGPAGRVEQPLRVATHTASKPEVFTHLRIIVSSFYVDWKYARA
jgi:hypothetical protein